MAQLSSEGFVQSDYDELVRDEPMNTALDALRLFKAILVTVVHTRVDTIPLLVIPLNASVRRIVRPPALGRVLHGRWDGPELPAFYLTTPKLWSLWDDVEEYRVPVFADAEGLEGMVCYYRCFRDRQARERGWEYTRAFYLRPR